MASRAAVTTEPQHPEPLLKMSELAERSGVSAGTIKHYLREGLLPEPVRTSRNMAYYPESFVERIRLIKRLQEERFMPLGAIRRVLDEDPDRAAALLDLQARLNKRAIADRQRAQATRDELLARYDIPVAVLDRLVSLGVLTPSAEGFDAE